MSLNQLLASLQNGNIPRRAVVVTFDDGYADNLYQAKPLLEQYQIPATVFVTTANVGQKREFWWDEMERILLQPGTLPESLELQIGKEQYQWHLDKDAHYSEEQQARDRYWHIYQAKDPGGRHVLFRKLHQLFAPLSISKRHAVLEDLARWGSAGLKARPTHRVLSGEEIKALAVGGLIEVGAHTVDHPRLSTLSPEEQGRQIRESKVMLEELLGKPVSSFAFPHGSRSDYTKDTIRIVRESGFTCSCANFSGVVRRGADRFQLPRALVYDWDGAAFRRQLQELLLV